MQGLHWNESLARFLKDRFLYAIDSQSLNQTQLHSQPGLEFNFTCAGRGTLYVGSESFALAAGTLVFVPESVPHRLEVHTKGRYVRSVLCLAPSLRTKKFFDPVLGRMLRKMPFREPRCLYLDEASARVIRTLISRIANETAQQASWWQDMAQALTYELMAFSARLTQRSRPLQPPGSRLAEEAASYIALHLEGDLALHKVARHFGFSREHFSRGFRQHFGVTYHRYVLNQRLAFARQLLQDTNSFSLLEIALAAGFQSHATFSRVFRQHEGITPKEFRTLHQACS